MLKTQICVTRPQCVKLVCVSVLEADYSLYFYPWYCLSVCLSQWLSWTECFVFWNVQELSDHPDFPIPKIVRIMFYAINVFCKKKNGDLESDDMKIMTMSWDWTVKAGSCHVRFTLQQNYWNFQHKNKALPSPQTTIDQAEKLIKSLKNYALHCEVNAPVLKLKHARTKHARKRSCGKSNFICRWKRRIFVVDQCWKQDYSGWNWLCDIR